jgi:hypothetical protein
MATSVNSQAVMTVRPSSIVKVMASFLLSAFWVAMFLGSCGGTTPVGDPPPPDDASVRASESSLPAANSLRANCFLEARGLDIVVSHYNENTAELGQNLNLILSHPNVAFLSVCVIIYTKDDTPQEMAKQLPFALVRWQHNIGREGAAYMDYIIRDWDNHARHILCIQGNIEYVPRLLSMLKAFDHSTGFMCLGFWLPANCVGDGQWMKEEELLRELWVMARNDLCFDGFASCVRGQFLVSSRRLRRHPLKFYRRVYRSLMLPADHIIHKGKLLPGSTIPSTPNNSMFLHALERAWSFIFECHSPGEGGANETMQHHELGLAARPIKHKHRMHKRQYSDGLQNCACHDTGSCPDQVLKGSCQCMDHDLGYDAISKLDD